MPDISLYKLLILYSAQLAVDIVGNTNSHGKSAVSVPTSLSSTPSESRSSKTYAEPSRTEDWELDCEVCGAKGVNRVCHSSVRFALAIQSVLRTMVYLS